jgi:hypothetical protein
LSTTWPAIAGKSSALRFSTLRPSTAPAGKPPSGIPPARGGMFQTTLCRPSCRLDVADAGASVGDLDMDDTSDRSGTGERMGAGKEQTIRPGADIDTDRVVGADEAGLGCGLDEAERELADDERSKRSASRDRHTER